MTPTHVLQEDAYGCGLACIAMVTGQTYQAVLADFTYRDHGITDWSLRDYLGDKGYATIWKHPCRMSTNTMRENWPPALWADVHIAQVYLPAGGHFIVVLRDGTVLDPATTQPRRWEDYPNVGNIGAIYEAAR
jgi:hypothetical protein